MLGELVEVIVPQNFRDQHRAGLQRVFSGGEPHLEGASTNLPVLLPDGTVQAFAGRLNLVRGPGGDLVAAVVVQCPRSGHEQPWTPVGD